MKSVGVIGEGAWGTAVAQVIADNGHQVNLWCYDSIVAEQINTKHANMRYASDFVLPENIYAHEELEPVLAESDFIFISRPTAFFRTIVERCKPFYNKQQCWVVLSKGIENKTLKLPTQILQEVLSPQICLGVLGGPSFAQEVLARQQTGVMVAAFDLEIAKKIAQIVANNYFYVATNTDVLGVQLGGALKNVVALMMGVAQGADFGDNARALLFTCGWRELVAIACALGADQQTLFDLPGIGDAFLTVTGKYSRNLAIGITIGRGDATGFVHTDSCVLPEGINTIQSIKELIVAKNIRAPLCEMLYAVIFESAIPKQLLQAAVSSVFGVEKR